MRIGYSFWGFLGDGVTDTPDGGRSHRLTLTDGLIEAGHEIVFLHADRDLIEAGQDFRDRYTWDAGLPDIDLLFVEWRWPIRGRNTTRCGAPGHTCDLHRQRDLIRNYTRDQKLPTIIWDKDRMLSPRAQLRRLANVIVCEAALAPSPGAVTLLFPVSDQVLDNADPASLAALTRPLQLVYVGNQYDRDAAFAEFFAPAARCCTHQVAGKWSRTHDWPSVNFTGRCPFRQTRTLYQSSLATVLLLPDRYAMAGQMTQRIFEAALAGCLPITPTTISFAEVFTPAELHAVDGQHVAQLIRELQSIAGTTAHADLIRACLDRLDIFRLSRQLSVIHEITERIVR